MSLKWGAYKWQTILDEKSDFKDDFSFWHDECEDRVGYVRREAQQALKLLKLERYQGWRYRIWVLSTL